MKKILLTIIITVLKILANVVYCFLKLLPTTRKIVMITRQSNFATLDFELIREYIEENEKNIKVVILAKKLEKGLKDKICYAFYSLKMMYHLATSKICVVDGYCIPVSILKHKNKLKVIQIWHASGAIKKFGYQILDKKEGANSLIAELMCMHKNYDYVIAPSDTTINIFAEAFNVPKEKFVKFGLPRLEYIADSKYDKSDKIYTEYPILKERKNIVYIPTFRKNEPINLDEILNYKLDEEKYNLIINLHPLDKTEVPEKYLVSKKYSSFDLIKIADYIITDYSALSIEASVLNKPIFLYLNDVEDYKNNRGLNINFENELPSFICKNFGEIIDKIEKKEYNMKELDKYREKYLEVNPNSAIKDLGGFLLRS